MKLSNEQLSNAIQFIIENTREEGLIRAYAEDLTEGQIEFEDLTTFVTGFTGIHLMDIQHPLLIELKQKMLLFLSNEVINSRFWMWASLNSDLRKIIPIDIDTTSINSELLYHEGINTSNSNILLKNKPYGNKGFYTWIILRFNFFYVSLNDMLSIYRHGFYRRRVWQTTSSTRNELNALVSINAYRYLILKKPSLLAEAENYIDQYCTVEEMHCVYYPNYYTRHFLISRILEKSTNINLIDKFVPNVLTLNDLNDLELSMYILTMKNLKKVIPEIFKLELLNRQRDDGSWDPNPIFCKMDSMVWRSPGFNTATALAALGT